MLVEKNHGVHASSKKKHQVLSSATLTARSFGAMTAILTRMHKDDYRIELLEQKVDRLEKQKPGKVNGTIMLCSFVVSDEFAHWAADFPVESFAFRAVHECMMARPRG